MAQVKTFTWTNPNPAVARNLDCGFDPVEITIVDLTNGGSWYWNSGFTDGYVLDVDAGTIASSNGVTPLTQNAVFGVTITAMSAANPCVITASNISQVGVAAGDVINVDRVADDLTGTSLNGDYTVASVTATAITTTTSTSSGYSAYVSGGIGTRKTDTNGDPVPSENYAIRGLTLGTSAVGASSASMTAVVRGDEPVV